MTSKVMVSTVDAAFPWLKCQLPTMTTMQSGRIRDGSAISTSIPFRYGTHGCFVLGCRSSGDGDCGKAM